MEEQLECVDIRLEDEKFNDIIEKVNIKDWITSIYKELNINNKYCAIFFVTGKTIREYNKQYLDRDYETDVLSFSQVEGEGLENNNFLGDIVISISFAEAHAKKSGHQVEEEIRYLILHGILHLLGYDHGEDETDRMCDMEKNIYYKLTGDIIE